MGQVGVLRQHFGTRTKYATISVPTTAPLRSACELLSSLYLFDNLQRLDIEVDGVKQVGKCCSPSAWQC